MRQAPTGTILVVDDNAAARYINCRNLRNAGFNTVEASTGNGGIQGSLEQPDLILLDVNLPDMNGFEVCSKIKAVPALATIPILMISMEFLDAGSQIRGLEAGADAYLTPPIEGQVLVAQVKALIRAHRAERELEEFCYSVSHDLRAPLRALDGFSDELLRSFPGKVLDERGCHYLNRIRNGTQRMGRLIDDLLRFFRFGNSVLRMERVDLSGLAESIATELQEQEPGRQATFTIEPGLIVNGDAGLLMIVIQNLLGNAWKFTAKKSIASIVIGRKRNQSLQPFFVRDNGAGFDMAHAAQLFGAFRRLHPEREFPGNGIGLATVRRVIHRHGGKVWAEGKPGEGATFYFTLPGEVS